MLLFLVTWYASGLLGSYLSLEFLFRRNRETPLDIEVGDVIAGMFLALTGPLNLIVGIIFLIAHLVGGVIDIQRTIFKRHSH